MVIGLYLLYQTQSQIFAVGQSCVVTGNSEGQYPSRLRSIAFSSLNRAGGAMVRACRLTTNICLKRI